MDDLSHHKTGEVVPVNPESDPSEESKDNTLALWSWVTAALSVYSVSMGRFSFIFLDQQAISFFDVFNMFPPRFAIFYCNIFRPRHPHAF
jgi:hypothetical protein